MRAQTPSTTPARVIISAGGSGLVDDPGGITVTGCAPESTVVVRAVAERAGSARTATATFRSDTAGGVSTATDPSLAGTYRGIDPFGLGWSGDSGVASVTQEFAPIRWRLTAENCGQV